MIAARSPSPQQGIPSEPMDVFTFVLFADTYADNLILFYKRKFLKTLDFCTWKLP